MTEPLTADVVIAGGGLAGAATAIALAQRGLSSVVVDKAEFPREKPCGEGLLPHGVSLLQGLGIGDVVEACGGQPFRGILYHCGGVIARGDFDGGESGRGLRRRLLDEAVRKKAEERGVVFVNGVVAGVVVDGEGGALTLSDGRVLRGKVVVGADGPRSTVRHGLDLDGGPPSHARYALRQHFRLAPGVPLPERVEVHVGVGHEMYVTPVGADDGSGAIVGVAALCEKRVMEAGEGKPAERLARLIAGCAPLAERTAGSVVDGPALACGPLRVHSKAVWRGRGVLVGDAAGYVDAITGEGMSLALKTATLAADAIRGVVDGRGADVEFAVYAKRRMAAFRDHAILTVGLVELARRPFFCRRAIARLAKDPALFTRLLAVNNGTKSLTSLGVLDVVKLAVGSSPPRLLESSV